VSETVEAVEAVVPLSWAERPEVRRHRIGDAEVVLVGTAHVSAASIDLVREVIADLGPDRVCLELDPQRLDALRHRTKWAELDVREVLRRKQVPTLMLSLLLASWQKRLGAELGVEPGAELLAGFEAAEAGGHQVELIDRDVRLTVRRALGSMGWWARIRFVSELLVSLLDPGEASAEEIEKLKETDALTGLLEDLGARYPSLKTTVIDERDQWLATRLLQVCRETGAGRVVAVVGAGHLAGMEQAIRASLEADLDRLATVPPPGRGAQVIGWGIPAAIVGSLAWIGFTRGPAAFAENALYWILANGIPAAIGALVALAHPLTVATAFVAAPITSLTPVIGAGYVTALVQAWLRPPRVRELEQMADDAATTRGWWSNRMLKILLAFILPGLGSMLGTFIGGFEIFSNLK
jgi:pheromone shutdown-related protein TraB